MSNIAKSIFVPNRTDPPKEPIIAGPEIRYSREVVSVFGSQALQSVRTNFFEVFHDDPKRTNLLQYIQIDVKLKPNPFSKR